MPIIKQVVPSIYVGTIEMWIRSNFAGNDSRKYVMLDYFNAVNNRITISKEANNEWQALLYGDENSVEVNSSSTSSSAGDDVHIVFRYDRNKTDGTNFMQLYINAVETDQSTSDWGNFQDVPNTLFIGEDKDQGNTFNGDIHLRVWDLVLPKLTTEASNQGLLYSIDGNYNSGSGNLVANNSNLLFQIVKGQ